MNWEVIKDELKKTLAGGIIVLIVLILLGALVSTMYTFVTGNLIWLAVVLDIISFVIISRIIGENL